MLGVKDVTECAQSEGGGGKETRSCLPTEANVRGVVTLNFKKARYDNNKRGCTTPSSWRHFINVRTLSSIVPVQCWGIVLAGRYK